MGLEELVDGCLVTRPDAGDDEVLVGGQPEVADVDPGDLGQPGLHWPVRRVAHPAVLDEQRVVPVAVVVPGPAVAIAGVVEPERPRRRQGVAEPTLDLGAEPVDAAILDRVFEPRVLAVRPIAEVALHQHHLLGHIDRLLGQAKAHDVGGPGKRLGLAVGHAHAAADRDVVADHAAGLIRDRDEAQIMGEHVDVVAGRHRHHDLELSRQVVGPVDRLLGLAAKDLLAVEPDLVIGAGARRQMVADRARQA